jgi:HAD superfamily hydrolase (TIGR01509 family)
LANQARQNTPHQVKIIPMSQIHPISMKIVPNLNTLKAGYPEIQTLLFDMDGTLFDTEKYHTLALQSIGREQDIRPPFGPSELHQLMMGKADHLLFEIIKDWPGFPSGWDVHTFVNEKNRHLLEVLKVIDSKLFFSTKIETLLKESNDAGINIGLVTSSEKVITQELLKMSNSSHYFHFILTRDDSLRVKPDPWPYIEAMKYFNSNSINTLIFEDSHIGIQAATSSGAHVIKAEWY